MEEVKELLSKRWVLRSKKPETYYKLKDNYHKYSDFIKQKLGYNIIINPLLIKVEKIPGRPQTFMGIQDFQRPRSYVFLCLVLMYLEDLDPGQQFILSFVLDYVKDQYPGQEPIEWTSYDNRTQMIKVLRYCIQEGLIVINDGDDTSFKSSDQSVAVLYENTGTSKYFMRRFPFDVSDVEDLEDFSSLEWMDSDEDRGLIRRHRIYRRLFMEPVVYQEGPEDQDYLYLKNYNAHIRKDVETYLDADFHLHGNGAMVLMDDNRVGFPNNKNISDVILQFCGMIQDEDLERDRLDIIVLSHLQWEGLVSRLKDTYSSGWSKINRDMALSQLNADLKEEMTYLGMVEIEEDRIRLMPLVGKVRGNYPQSYWETINGKMADK